MEASIQASIPNTDERFEEDSSMRALLQMRPSVRRITWRRWPRAR